MYKGPVLSTLTSRQVPGEFSKPYMIATTKTGCHDHGSRSAKFMDDKNFSSHVYYEEQQKIYAESCHVQGYHLRQESSYPTQKSAYNPSAMQMQVVSRRILR